MGIIGLILGIVSVIIGAFTSLKWLAIVIAIISIVLSGVNIFIRLKNSEKYILSIIGVIIALLAIIISIVFLNINNNTRVNVTDEKVYKVGSTYKEEDLSIKFLSCDTDYSVEDKSYITPGYKVLKMDFEIENKGTVNILFTEKDFKCYSNADECQNFFISNDNFYDIKPGVKETVSYYYEIPIDSNDIKVEYDIGDISKENVMFVIK